MRDQYDKCRKMDVLDIKFPYGDIVWCLEGYPPSYSSGDANFKAEDASDDDGSE